MVNILVKFKLKSIKKIYLKGEGGCYCWVNQNVKLLYFIVKDLLIFIRVMVLVFVFSVWGR